ncbi:MAG: hypothetical protein IK005_00180 [Paludibacteraceae bacterium]|nr:hypothetical protein [Paludibacteraceae bacterium]
MNKKTKQQLAHLSSELLQMMNRVSEIQEIVSSIADDERCKFDNAPESLQCSDKYSEMESAADEFDSISDNFDEIVSNIDEIVCVLDDFSDDSEELESLEKEAMQLEKKLRLL